MVAVKFKSQKHVLVLFLVAVVPAFCGIMFFSGYGFLVCLVILSLVFGVGICLGKSSRRQPQNLAEQLYQSQKLAALGEISAGVAHEINNPMAIINQEAELMLYHVNNENLSREELGDGLHQILLQVERCAGITGKMLDFARKPERISQAVDLNQLTEGVLNLVMMEARRKNIEIITKYQPGPMVVMVDAPLLRQVVLNILNNALQAVSEEGRITIATRYSGPLAEIEISDNGPGFGEDAKDKLFTPFYTTKPPGFGTGLGLSVSLRIMDEIGGTIKAESVKGEGAFFTIRFPSKRQK